MPIYKITVWTNFHEDRVSQLIFSFRVNWRVVQEIDLNKPVHQSLQNKYNNKLKRK